MTATPSASTGKPAAAAVWRAWAPTLLAIGVAAAAFGAAFSHEIAGAVAVWIGSTAYNHCFLVLPMAAFLLWDRRPIIAGLQPRPALWPLFAMIPVALVWVTAAFLDILEGEQLAAMVLFEILLLSLVGFRTYRALLGPFLFLFFLVPFGAFLVPTLQRWTTAMAVIGLQLVHIPVFANGFVIEIPEGTFEVAQACAGLRFLIASIVFGCFFSLVVYRSWFRRLAFILASFVVPILANGARAFGLIALAHIAGSATAIETDHILYGWLFFSLVTLLLIGLGIGFRDRGSTPAIETITGACPSTLRSGGVAVLGVVLAATGPASLSILDGMRPTSVTEVPASLAPVGAAWTAAPRLAGGWRPTGAGALRRSFRRYTDGAAAVSQFVAAYPLHARNGQLTTTVSRIANETTWHVLARHRRRVRVDDRVLTVEETEIGGKGQRRLVWWFYLIGRRTTASRLAVKLFEARAVFEGGPGFGAYVALSTIIDGPLADARTRLARFLQVMRPMGHRL